MATLKKNDVVRGKVTNFTYVGKDGARFCKITIVDADAQSHSAICGTAEQYPFPVMIGLRGEGVHAAMTYQGVVDGYPRYNNVAFEL